QRRNRRDVTESQSNAANKAVSEIDQPEMVRDYAQVSDVEAQRETNGRCQHCFSGARTFEPFTECGSGKTQHDDGEREDPRDLCLLPVLWGGFGHAQQLREWNFENAEGVNLADAQMNGQRRWRNQPPAV